MLRSETKPHPEALRMAEVLRERRGAAGNCSKDELHAEGFDLADIERFYPTAAKIARQSMLRIVEENDRANAQVKREGQARGAARIAFGLLPTEKVVRAALVAHGMPGDLAKEAMADAFTRAARISGAVASKVEGKA